jgi:hypothetical protein
VVSSCELCESNISTHYILCMLVCGVVTDAQTQIKLDFNINLCNILTCHVVAYRLLFFPCLILQVSCTILLFHAEFSSDVAIRF